MTLQERIEKAGAIAVDLSIHLKASEQAFFIAGFQECIKWQELKAEIDKSHTLTVDIPETVDGLCNMDCPFFVPNVVVNHCLLRLSAIADDFYCKPFKGCPRFSNGGDK